MEFKTLGEEERKLLLNAIDFDINNLICKYCGEKTNYKDCSILPPIHIEEFGRITCSSPLCLSEYLEDIEKQKKLNTTNKDKE